MVLVLQEGMLADMLQVAQAMKAQLDVHLIDKTKKTPAHDKVLNALDKNVASLKKFMKITTITVEDVLKDMHM
jgi:hypothetical protein